MISPRGTLQITRSLEKVLTIGKNPLHSSKFPWLTATPRFAGHYQQVLMQLGTQKWNDARPSLFDGHADNQTRIRLIKVTLTFLMLFLATFASAAEKPSQPFPKKAIQGNYAEVEMGKLAQQNGQSDNVKNFGKMLQVDHTAANEKAIDVAKSMGVTPPDGPNAKQKDDYEKMSKMSGPRFDRDCAAYMVADHQKDIAEYKKASKGADPAGEYAKGNIPVLQKHLATATSLTLKKTSGSRTFVLGNDWVRTCPSEKERTKAVAATGKLAISAGSGFEETARLWQRHLCCDCVATVRLFQRPKAHRQTGRQVESYAG